MRILNIGSINIDHVYEVQHFVRPGETLAGLSYNTFVGGKGFNQSVALARAGAATLHAGRIGKDATWLIQRLEQDGIDATHVSVDETATGRALSQGCRAAAICVTRPGASDSIPQRSELATN